MGYGDCAVTDDMNDDDAAAFDALQARLEELRRLDGGSELIDFVQNLAKKTGRTILEFGEAVAPLALEAGKAALISLVSSEIEGLFNKRK